MCFDMLHILWCMPHTPGSAIFPHCYVLTTSKYLLTLYCPCRISLDTAYPRLGCYRLPSCTDPTAMYYLHLSYATSSVLWVPYVPCTPQQAIYSLLLIPSSTTCYISPVITHILPAVSCRQCMFVMYSVFCNTIYGATTYSLVFTRDSLLHHCCCTLVIEHPKWMFRLVFLQDAVT